MARQQTYEVGDLVICTGTFTTPAGALYDPATVTFKMTEPDGIVTTYTYAGATVARTSIGVYTVNWPVAKVYTHTYQFAGVSSSNQRTVSKTFYVKPTVFA